MVGIRSPDGLVVGLAPATLEFWVRFPNERNQGNRAPPCFKVPGSSRVPSPHANSFIKGTAVINTHIPSQHTHPCSGGRHGPTRAPSVRMANAAARTPPGGLPPTHWPPAANGSGARPPRRGTKVTNPGTERARVPQVALGGGAALLPIHGPLLVTLYSRIRRTTDAIRNAAGVDCGLLICAIDALLRGEHNYGNKPLKNRERPRSTWTFCTVQKGSLFCPGGLFRGSGGLSVQGSLFKAIASAEGVKTPKPPGVNVDQPAHARPPLPAPTVDTPTAACHASGYERPLASSSYSSSRPFAPPPQRHFTDRDALAVNHFHKFLRDSTRIRVMDDVAPVHCAGMCVRC